MLAGELEAGLLLQVDGAGLALEAYGLVTLQEASLSIHGQLDVIMGDLSLQGKREQQREPRQSGKHDQVSQPSAQRSGESDVEIAELLFRQAVVPVRQSRGADDAPDEANDVGVVLNFDMSEALGRDVFGVKIGAAKFSRI